VRASRWVEQPWPTWRQASARFRVLVVCLAVVAFAADFASAALIVSDRGILVFVVIAAALTFGLPLWSALVRAREESLTSHT
ncbi:MAG: hypothetical protein U1E29_04450, partial [Coriobacteriia bacterium]|nr:hypothetical protein [Coriobacteriia bacterium]